MTIALATCVNLPEPDPDQELLLGALAAAGLAAELLAWDDPAADPARHDLCVLRSTWNYPEDSKGFTAWIDRAAAATTLLNPAPVLHWNLHKGYLAQLEDRGVPIIPTAFVERGAHADLPLLLGQHGWDDVVVKPAISAGSFLTRRFDTGDTSGEHDLTAGEEFLYALTEKRDALVQPYMTAVDTDGERCMVWIDGALTHAVRKQPRFAGSDEQVSEALEPTDDERALVDQTLAAFTAATGCPLTGLLYARIDVIRDDDGTLRLSELELLEPSLFLLQSPAALERLVAGMARRAAAVTAG